MWGIIDAYSVYIKAGLAIVLLLGAFAWGWHSRDVDFYKFKIEVDAVAKEQKAKVASIEQQHKLVTKGISDEYEAKLALLHNYYKSTSVWHKPSSGAVSDIPTATTVPDVIASYNVLAGQCADTTLQLVELQKWMLEQAGIK
jgi:hypothetical protein